MPSPSDGYESPVTGGRECLFGLLRAICGDAVISDLASDYNASSYVSVGIGA
ncbi:hypothetical protein [Streptomyces sp. NPDC059491]|uniref:hypothetical protein n=1 Tax=Streptomyces sp. NPDC059491 TaxID=3346850 RepID=UPI0036B8BB8D